MTFRPSSSLPITVNKHQDRGLTLVFGSDGQVSLIGFGDGVASQPLRTFTASNTGAHSLPSGPNTISPLPNLDVTTASLTGTPSSTAVPTSTPFSSSASSSYDPPASATNTDTNLPSVPTVIYPTPTPTAVSGPKDLGVGAPFYLAIVLASVSFIGCVSAFVAWRIRSRSRKRDLELEDPWLHSNSISDASILPADNVNEFKKEPQILVEAQTRPYYVLSSIVHRSSSNLLTVPHTRPASDDGTPQNDIARAALGVGHQVSRSTYNSRSQNSKSNFKPNTDRAALRPGAERIQSELSVQESTRTLGRLRVANRVPGDITSGDEGGMSMPRLQQIAGLAPDTKIDKVSPVPAGENVMQAGLVPPGSRSFTREANNFLEPPGPATTSWGRRIDNVAALRRTRRRISEMAVQTHQNPLYGGPLYSTQDAGSSSTMRMSLSSNGQKERETAVGDPPPDPLRWTNTFRSSFWHAIDAMTGNRSSDSESRVMDSGSGSRFTPAPQRAASRRSPVFPIRLTAGTSCLGTCTAQPQETETNYEVPSGKAAVAKEKPPNFTSSVFDGFLMRVDELGVPQIREGRAAGINPHLSGAPNNSLSTSTHRRHPDSLIAVTGSLYSTDFAAARANLNKYGYGDRIPSTWSALGARRESQLDMARTFLPLPRPIVSLSPSYGANPLSITPSQVTLQSSPQSDSVNTRTRMPLHFDRDLAGSDSNTLRSGETGDTPSDQASMVSDDNISRNGSIPARCATDDSNTSSQAASSSSMLGRKKGAVTRRKRPSPPTRASSTASSVQSLESGLSIREVAVKRALLERRKKVKAARSLKHREDHGDENA